MFVEIITIGDEILIGQTVDTNSAWMGKMLNMRGLDVVQITTVMDNAAAIINALNLAKTRAQVILMTGGLGPTKDDITKKTLAQYFNTTLELNLDVLKHIETLITSRGRKMNDAHREQAILPVSCEVIPNSRGTASGMWFEQDEHIVVSMPGVPYEMKTMMEDYIFAKIEKKYPKSEIILHQTITVVNIPESTISHRIAHIEDALPAHLHIAYLPHLNLVRLRLTGKSETLSAEELTEEMNATLGNICLFLEENYYFGEQALYEEVGKYLVAQNASIGTVESCSSGIIASQIVSQPGASAYFWGGLVTYAYSAKVKIANVSQEKLNQFGAVSKEVAEEMASNGKQILGSDYCLSTTGIAGPSGATEHKPVGLVYIGLALPSGEVRVEEYIFSGDRSQVIERTAYTALNMLRKALLKR